MAELALFIIILFSALLFSFVFFMLWQNIYSVPYVPSSAKRVKEALELVGVDHKTRFVDLGSGDGTVVLIAAQMGADIADGVEINPYLTILSRLRRGFGIKEDINFYHQSLFDTKLDKYNFAYVYLLPSMLGKVQDKLFSELPKGSIILSNTFKIPGREPDTTVAQRFHIYRVG